MEHREFLQPEGDGGRRYRIEELVATGRVHQVVRCRDLEHDRDVCAKTPTFEAYDGESQREARRESLAFEAEVLGEGHAGCPELIEHLELEVEVGEPVPALVYEMREGVTAHGFVAKRPREVLGERELTQLLRDVGEHLMELHDAGYLLRDVDPRHVLVDDSGEFAGFAGTGNIVRAGEPPIRPSSDYAEAPYVAPEARQERSGETLRPAADVYGFAALASYLYTGEEPTSAVESPLEARGFELLQHIEPEGLRQLVASGLQPVAKYRLELEEIVEAADPARLAAGDELLFDPDDIRDLPPPWSGADPPGENRAARSNLSSGPLISVPRGDSESMERDGGEDGSGATAPVEEFLGERNEVGSFDPDGGPPDLWAPEDDDGSVEQNDGAGEDSDDTDDVRRDEAGEPAREVSMVDENIRARDERAPDPSAGDEPPDLWDLPVGTKVLFGLVLPVGIMLLAIAVGLLTTL